MRTYYTRISDWLRNADNTQSVDSLVTRCYVAANVINNLEDKLRKTENELVLCQNQLKDRVLESGNISFWNFFRRKDAEV